MSIGTYVDCIMDVIGWYQISSQIDSNGLYLPETDPVTNGPIVVGGVTAYPRPGARPGDIVVLYNVTTAIAYGATATINPQFALWDILNPCGFSFFDSAYSFKSCIASNDIDSLFPHQGIPAQPMNPYNPGGPMDLLWKKATTQYGIPGPGNVVQPNFVRHVLPGFGVRLIVWSEECCVETTIVPPDIDPHSHGLTPRPAPGSGSQLGPEAPGFGPSGNPAGFGPGPGGKPGDSEIETGPNGEPGTLSLHSDMAPDKDGNAGPAEDIVPTSPGYDATSIPGLGNRASSGLNAKNDPRKTSTEVFGKNQKRTSVHQTMGTSAFASINVRASEYHGGVPKASDLALGRQLRAQRVGSGYLEEINNGSTQPTTRKRFKFFYNPTEDNAITDGRVAMPKQGTPSQEHRTSQSNVPAGKEGRARSGPAETRVETTPNRSRVEGHPKRRDELRLSNSFYPTSRAGYGGVANNQTVGSNPLFYASNRVPNTRGQMLSKRRDRGGLRDRIKEKSKKSNESNEGQDDNLLSTRAPRLKRQDAAEANTFTEQTVSIKRRIGIERKTRSAGSFEENIAHPRWKISIAPINHEQGSHLVIVKADVDSQTQNSLRIDYVTVRDDGRSHLIRRDHSGIITWGVVNPPQPGQFAIASTTCLPSTGFPNIQAGGTSVAFVQLIATLFSSESQVLAQTALTFLPPSPGALQVMPPNRLPVGVMEDLQMTDTATITYDGVYSSTHAIREDWYKSEPGTILERIDADTNSAVTVVVKPSRTSQLLSPSFKPALELYNNDLLVSHGSTGNVNSSFVAGAFVGGPCSAIPGWSGLTHGAIDTTCPGMAVGTGVGRGGAGGTSSFIMDTVGVVQSGPYNPGIYGNPISHTNFLHFRYDSGQPASSDSIYFSANQAYRVRVYNNGPMADENGYVLYTEGVRIPEVSTINVSIGTGNILQGNIITYHTNQPIKVLNATRGGEIERLSGWEDGKIFLGFISETTGNFLYDNTLEVFPGDTIKVVSPGFTNLYNSGRLIAEFTL